MDIKILVAAHKSYWMPKDSIYMPIHVGKEGKDIALDYTPDNTGDNISYKNQQYCELTGIYWAWKNLEADYIGLVHYRRYFAGVARWRCIGKDKRKYILNRNKLEQVLQQAEVVLPKKRNYYIETLYSHYAHTHDKRHLDIMKEIIGRQCPEYQEVFCNRMHARSAHMFNMFIMKKNYYDAYCSWLFPLLEELETKVTINQMSSYDARFIGRVSELLLDVWMIQNKIAYKELGYVYLGEIKWGKKMKSFLGAKFGKKKYQESF